MRDDKDGGESLLQPGQLTELGLRYQMKFHITLVRAVRAVRAVRGSNQSGFDLYWNSLLNPDLCACNGSCEANIGRMVRLGGYLPRRVLACRVPPFAMRCPVLTCAMLLPDCSRTLYYASQNVGSPIIPSKWLVLTQLSIARSPCISLISSILDPVRAPISYLQRSATEYQKKNRCNLSVTSQQ